MSQESDPQNSQDEKVTNEMESHNYDGIIECDNPMPNWWVWTFLLTIIFAFIYFVHYTFGGGPTLREELAQAMVEIEKTRIHEPILNETEESLEQILKDESFLAKGTIVFAEKCVACHGQELQGLVGPNLTDSYWIHGKGTRTDIVKLIRQGVVDKGMPSWDTLLKKEEIYGLTAYILSKKGSKPANPKAPQGEIVQ